jgi:hypothetical protein
VIVSAVVIITGIKKQPGIGIIVSVLVIGVAIGFNKLTVSDIGFAAPKNWLATVLWGIGLGVAITALSILIIETATEKIVGQPVDIKPFDRIRGNWKQLLLMLVVSWILAAFLEEVIFRGLLISELTRLIGQTGVWASIALLISAVVFGMAHWYQGKSGALGTAIIGLLLGDIFIWNGHNLWMLIIAHGVIDTIGLILIYLNKDLNLKKLLWKEQA